MSPMTFNVLFAITMLATVSLALDTAVLAIQKKLASRVIAAGKETTVTIKIMNVGTGAAFDVRADDDWVAEYFQLVQGEMKAEFETIEAGQTAEYSFTIVPKSTGTMIGFPAVISYKSSANASPTIALSSVRFPEIQIITQEMYNRFTNTHDIESNIFYIGAILSIVLPSLFQYYYNSYYVNGYHRDLFTAKAKQN